MELPSTLQAALEEELKSLPQKELLSAAEAVSLRYRERKARGFYIENRKEALAYALARMPATYGAVHTALSSALAALGEGGRLPRGPLSLLDLGAGTGAASWAAAGLLELSSISCLEYAPSMEAVGKSLMRRGEGPLKGARWKRADLASQPIGEEADVVVASYMLNELEQSAGLRAAEKAWQAAGKLLLLVEPIPNVGGPEAELIARIKTLGCPSVLVINKVDTLEHKEKLLEVIQTYGQAHEFTAVVPVSARTGEGVEELLDVLDGFLPQGPQLFPEDMVTDQPERQMMAEILREKLLLCLDKEIPHGTAVEITKFSERDDEVIEIDATIYCEKNSHKGIIIGKGGAMLKKVSSLARQDMERFMGTKVYLQTWVKVKENWRDNVNLIRNFGYRDE